MTLADLRRAVSSQLIAIEASLGLLFVGLAMQRFLPSLSGVARLVTWVGAGAVVLTVATVLYLAVFVIDAGGD